MPLFKIHHITKYEYDRPVKESVSQLRIFPQSNNRQLVRDKQLIIAQNPDVFYYTDYFGNTVGDFSLLAPHNLLVIDNRVTVETLEASPVPDPGTQLSAFQDLVERDIVMLQLSAREAIAEQWMIDHMLEEIGIEGKSVHQLVWACSEFIYLNFSYVKGITTVESKVDEILHHRSGVCQDFAHVCLQMLRSLDIPSRYVSGYICPNKSGLRGEGATHAWLEYYDPTAGWLGIDPTNNVWVNGTHVVLATGSNFEDCSPVKGNFKGIARQSLSVYVSVGYEDGHVFEDVNQVRMVTEAEEAMEAWQIDWMQAQQQQ